LAKVQEARYPRLEIRRPLRKGSLARGCSMTIGVGFLCRDGIVIGSDRQMTVQDSHTFTQEKTDSFSTEQGLVAWTYAGMGDTGKLFRDQIRERFASTVDRSRLSVTAYMQDVLKRVTKKEEPFYTLLGFCPSGGDGHFLLMSNGTDVVNVDRSEIIGGGDSSLLRFLRQLYLYFPFTPTLTQGAYSAVYSISQAAKFEGQWCGGGIDVWAIGTKGKSFVVTPGVADKWQKYMDGVEFKFYALLRVLTDDEMSDKRKTDEWKDFRENVARFCVQICPNQSNTFQ